MTAVIKWETNAEEVEAKIFRLEQQNLRLVDQLKTLESTSTRWTARAGVGMEGLARAAQKVWDDTRTPLERYNESLAHLQELLRQGAITQETFERAKTAGFIRLRETTEQYGAEASRIWNETRTPAERYEQTMARLNTLVAKGALDQETFGRASAQAKDALDRAGQGMDKTGQGMEGLARAGQRVWDETRTPVERYCESITHLQELLRQGAISHETFERARVAGFERLRESTDRYGAEAKAVFDQTRTPSERHQQTMERLNTLVAKGAIDQETYGRAAKQAGEAMDQAGRTTWLEKQADGLRGVVLGLIGGGGVIGAVAMVKQAYAEWAAKMDEIAEKQTERATSTVGKMRFAPGDLAHMDEITQGLEAQGVKASEGRAAFAGVTQADSLRAREDRTKLAYLVSRAAPVVGEEGMEQLGRTAGTLAKYMPGKSAEQVAGIAYQIQKLTPNAEALSGPRLQRSMAGLATAGVSGDEALAMIVAANQQGIEEGGAMIRAAEMMTAKLTRQNVTTENHVQANAHNRFARAKPQERLRLLREDREVAEAMLGTERAGLFRTVSADRVATAQQQIQTAGQRDVIADDLQTMERTRAGRIHLMTRQNEILTARKEADAADKALEHSSIRQSQDRRKIGEGAGNRGAYRVLHGLGWLLSGGQDMDLRTEEEKRTDAPTRIQSPTAASPESLKKMDEQTAQLKAINGSLQAIKNAPPSPSAVQGNLNQHTEK